MDRTQGQTVRVPDALVQEAQDLVPLAVRIPRLRPLVSVGHPDVLRLAIAIGLDVLRAEVGEPSP